MSRLDVTTQDLFLRLGSTSRSRSARADEVFRRLRSDEAAGIAEALMKPASQIRKPLSDDGDNQNDAVTINTKKKKKAAAR
ncbi:MAG: hypothetical protein AAGC77_10820 [Pseudomonadota bacterium]